MLILLNEYDITAWSVLLKDFLLLLKIIIKVITTTYY